MIHEPLQTQVLSDEAFDEYYSSLRKGDNEILSNEYFFEDLNSEDEEE